MRQTLIERLLEKYVAEYFEKLFYFCLKKTGDSHEAEELTSDITLNIVAALRKGTIPVNFPAWVWQIARNRYSIWADRRRIQRESDSGADIGDFELAQRQYSFSRETVLREFPAFMKEDFCQLAVAIDLVFTLRGAVLEEALRRGYLAYDETQPRRMLGVFMRV